MRHATFRTGDRFLGLRSMLLSLVLLAACQERAPAWDTPFNPIGPIGLGRHVAYVDAVRRRLTVVDGLADPPVWRAVPIGRGFAAATLVPAAETGGPPRLALATRGRVAERAGETTEAPELLLVDPARPDGSNDRRWSLPSPFDALVAAEDGRTLAAFFRPDTTGEEVLRNPAEIVFVDLASSAPLRVRTVRSFGTAPAGVVFSPPIALRPPADPTPRTLAVVLQAGALAFLDVARPERSEVTVPLAAGGATPVATEIVFAAGERTAFVRAAGLEDLYSITLVERVPPDAAHNDFYPVPNQLSAGRAVADLAAYDEAGERKLLATTSGGTLVVIDAATARFSTLPLGAGAERIALYPEGRPERALVWGPGAGARAWVVALDGLSRALGANVAEVATGQPLAEVAEVPTAERFLLIHDAGRTALSVLDLTRRTVTPILGSRLDRYAFTADGAYLLAISQQHPTPGLGVLEMATLHPATVRLDWTPRAVLALGAEAAWIDHGHPLGLVTVLRRRASGEAPFARAHAVALAGFLGEGLLDDGVR